MLMISQIFLIKNNKTSLWDQTTKQRIPNLQFIFTNVYYDFLCNCQTERKKMFGTNKM